MFCRHCGGESGPSARFCKHCGNATDLPPNGLISARHDQSIGKPTPLVAPPVGWTLPRLLLGAAGLAVVVSVTLLVALWTWDRSHSSGSAGTAPANANAAWPSASSQRSTTTNVAAATNSPATNSVHASNQPPDDGLGHGGSERSSDTATEQRAELPANFQRDFAGSLDGTIAIRMSLNRSGSSIRGTVVYVRYGRPISVRGAFTGDTSFALDEFDEKERFVGRYTGQFVSETSIRGTWSKPNGADVRTLELTATGR